MDWNVPEKINTENHLSFHKLPFWHRYFQLLAWQLVTRYPVMSSSHS